MSQFAWLGLLKWSLAYQDGTENVQAKEMSESDKSFLKSVMEDGIIDEGVRMRVILLALIKHLHSTLILNNPAAAPDPRVDMMLVQVSKLESEMRPKDKADLETAPSTAHLLTLLEELRDIVEQIDFAHSFVTMNGLPFLLGASAEPLVPLPVRIQCVKLIATLAQNNPNVQKISLENDTPRILADLFQTATDPALKCAVLQALSATVRGHAASEATYLLIEEKEGLISNAIVNDDTDDKVLMRAIFFLRALISDSDSGKNRISLFASTYPRVVALARSHTSLDVRETSLSILVALMDMGDEGGTFVYGHAEAIQEGAKGAMEKLQAAVDQEEKDMVRPECDLWMECVKRIPARTDGNN